MKITLYKKCILTNSYSEVFDTFHKDSNGKTSLERYLATLPKIEINAGEVYYTNGGKISFDIFNIGYENVDFYTFNYMKFENDDATFVRYCFIDMITVVNNIAVVSYIEDIWSCYAKTMKMRKSLLTRSRIIDYGDWQIPFYAPGMTYESNNFANIVLLDESRAPFFSVNVILQLQLYTTTEQGTINERIVQEVAMKYKPSNATSYTYNINLSTALILLQDIIRRTSTQQVEYGSGGTKYYCEIYNILVIPTSFNVVSTFTTPSSDIVYDNLISFKPLFIFDVSKKVCKTYELATNFKRYKIGTFTKCYDVVENGTNTNLQITAQCGVTDFSLYLEFQNQIIDITKDFILNIPISVQTADVTQQQATSRELAQMNAKLGIANGSMQIAQGVSDMKIGGAKLAFGITTGQAGSVLSGASTMQNAPFKMASGIMNIISSAKQLEIANRSMFTTNKGIQADPNATINAVYGLIALEVNADNEVEVQANIDNVGYVCNEVVDDLLNTITTGMTNKYNVMQFDYVNIYGAFTQSIADALRDILYGGFKIWYDETGINE